MLTKLFRIALCISLIFSAMLSFAQEDKKIYFRAQLLEYDEAIEPDVEHYTGDVIFRHQKTIGYCDKADHNRRTNRLEAHGDPVIVVINDSVKLYGQYVIYDAETRTVSIHEKVILKDKSATLHVDSLFYDLNKDIAYYVQGGRMTSDSNTLTSEIGQYHTKTKMAYLYDSVKLVNSSYRAHCDKASFDTQNETVYFLSRTHLISDENEIYTDRGWYDTKHDITLLAGNAELFNQDQSLTGDSLYYDKANKFGQGWNHVRLVDSVKNFILQGNYIEFKEDDYADVTDSSLLVLIDNEDSLFLHSDTLHMLFDSTSNPKEMYAYNHVKFYRDDLQGACDSMTYLVEDSLITMYFNPVVWSGENQLTADTIVFRTIDSLNMDLELHHSAFVASSLFKETEFNQVKGLTIVGRIHDHKLTRVDVVGNAECLYYILEEDSSLIGINSAITSEMTIVLDNNEIKTITFYNNPDGKLYPDKDLSKEDRLLKDFKWMNPFRPKTMADIYINPVERPKTETEEEETE